MVAFTKPGFDIFAPTDGGGAPRQVVNAEAQTWAAEVEANVTINNDDGGLTRTHTAATQAVDYEPFGGLFASAAAANSIKLNLTGLHTGPRFAWSLAFETEGKNANGPGSAAYALWYHGQKTNYLTSTEPGEVDLFYGLLNQGMNGDCAGGLIGVNKVDGGTGGAIAFETVVTRVNSSGVSQLSNDTVINFLEGAGGLSSGKGIGVFSEARDGTIGLGFMASAGTDFGGALDYWFGGSQSRNTTTIGLLFSTDVSIGARLLNSWTDESNNEAGLFGRWAANVFQMGTDSPGSGTTREMELVRDGARFLTSTNTGPQLATAMSLRFSARGNFSPAADGVFTLYNNAFTGFDRLQLGGTTSSFPAIKRNAAVAEIKLADDSAYAALNAGAITVMKGTAVPAGGTAGAGLMFSTTANLGVFFGSGAPTLSAAKGSLYIRTDGSSTTTRAYVNTDGGTTWTYLTAGA